MSSLGDRLKAHREKLNLTQQDLAEKLKMTRANLSSYEQNRNVPPVNVLSSMADIFNVSVDYLLGRTDLPYEIYINENTELDEKDQVLLKSFLARSEEMLRDKGGLSEDKLRQVLRFMEFTFLEDLEDSKNKK